MFRIRIRIHMFLGLPDSDPLVRGMDPVTDPDPGPSIILLLSSKNSKKIAMMPYKNPLVRGMDPRIRIHTRMSWIRNTAYRYLHNAKCANH